ncbi:MAG: Uracil-DNA glycosylase [Pseudomonadota bacterium]
MRLNQTDLFTGEGTHWGVPAPSNQLLAPQWPPSMEALTEAWQDLLRDFWRSATGSTLDKKVSACLASGQVIFPDSPYRALALTPFEKVQVVVLGQDPYHGPDQAQGLAFSVGVDQKIPPSLRNIFKEIQRDLGAPIPSGADAGSLVRWAEQGVLLLNTALTVEQSKPASHSDWGWEVLTDKIIQALSAHPKPKAFLLWGAHAQSKSKQIEALNDQGRHLVLKANHPSPLSALRRPTPFMGCGHFGQVNRWLEGQKKKPILW